MTSKTPHPYAAIEHRVIDSEAFADLSPSAVHLLVLIARQLTKTNNGHLQAAYSYVRRFGVGSEHTLARSIKQLISHGFIYRTKMGGYQQGPSLYAVTWLPITQRQGLFLHGYKPCAWRNWEQEKIPPTKMQPPSCKNGQQPRPATAQTAGAPPTRIADYELMPVVIQETASPHPDEIVFPWEESAGG
jgi:hypothetical protein